MLDQSTASLVRGAPLKLVRGVAAAITGFLVFTDTVSEAIRTMLGGYPDLEGWIRIYVVGSYTLPLTVGVTVIVFMLMNEPPMAPPAATLALYGAILVGAGLISTALVSFAVPVTFASQPGPLYACRSWQFGPT